MENILFILHLPPPVHGSSIVGQSIKNSQLINSSFDCYYINLLASRTINETGKMSFLKFFRYLGVWFKLLIKLIERKPDICYLALSTTDAAFYKDVLLVALLRLFSVKRVYHLHNKGVSKGQTKMINKLLYQFVFKDADVVLLSNHLYQDIETFVPVSRVYICPNGVLDNANVMPRLIADVKPVRILFLSNLIKSKGVLVLLEACFILQQKGIDFKCNVVGAEGDLTTNQFNELILQNKLSSKVNYLGKKFGMAKQEIFESTDIFVFPTFYSNECFPLVLLEAMSASLPIVSTFEGGIPDIVEDGTTGYLVHQKDAEALVEKLVVLINNPDLRERMGKAGREKYENEFTLNVFENRMTEILHQIIKNKL